MKAWFTSREPREQRALIAAAVVLTLFLLYALIWQPLHRDVQRLRASARSQMTSLAWMKQASAEVQRLRASARPRMPASPPQPLLTLADQTIRSEQLRAAVRRLEPRGEHQVQLWVENVDFDPLVRWLTNLRTRRAVVVTAISIDRQTTPGVINAHVTLTDQLPTASRDGNQPQ